jgi:hypothetical protein
MIMRVAALAVAALCVASPLANADAVSDWNELACTWVADAKLPTPIAVRVLSIAHTAVYEAVNGITRKYPAQPRIQAAGDATVEAAVAAANRATLANLLPAQAQAIENAYSSALAAIPEGPAKAAGIAAGDAAAAAVLAERAADGVTAQENYRPVTSAGVYVPTTVPAVPQWPARKPWLMTIGSELRPGPPPALTSETWTRDFAEIKTIGAKTGSTRTKEQTDIALFWEATLPSIYHGILRSVADQAGRDITRNARLFAAATQAMDDAVIAVFDAKYHYNFWRPITAIRNADIDGNDATERAPSWTPLVDTPMHPEYPCAHCIISGTLGTVIQSETGKDKLPKLVTTSYMIKDSERSWPTTEAFIKEVSEARIYDGVHYRNSTEVGTAMGRKVGELAVNKHFATP